MKCIQTNIFRAENMIKAAIANNVDKAANPVQFVPGCTKLASDKLFIIANNIVCGGRTRFTAVRYGNVVGSRGLWCFLKA